MTDLADPPLLRVPASPRAARLAPRRWRDVRLLVGVFLILVSVLLGVRVVAAAGRTTDVVAAARPLAAGDVLSAGDLTVVAVHLPASSLAGYWPGAQESALLGRRLSGPLGAGSLLARTQIAAARGVGPQREVSVPVDPTRLADVAPGERVDVYATNRTATGAGGVTVVVVTDVIYLGSAGSSSTGDVAVHVEVPVADTGVLVHASEAGNLDVVRVDPAGGDVGAVGSAPIAGDTGAAGSAPGLP
jgi:hypothetical protein